MGYTRFQIGCVFVEYNLFNTTTFIQNLIYIRFGLWYNFHTVLFKFLETGTLNKSNIGRDQLLK